jgi:hypothetical protein
MGSKPEWVEGATRQVCIHSGRKSTELAVHQAPLRWCIINEASVQCDLYRYRQHASCRQAVDLPAGLSGCWRHVGSHECERVAGGGGRPPTPRARGDPLIRGRACGCRYAAKCVVQLALGSRWRQTALRALVPHNPMEKIKRWHGGVRSACRLRTRDHLVREKRAGEWRSCRPDRSPLLITGRTRCKKGGASHRIVAVGATSSASSLAFSPCGDSRGLRECLNKVKRYTQRRIPTHLELRARSGLKKHPNWRHLSIDSDTLLK